MYSWAHDDPDNVEFLNGESTANQSIGRAAAAVIVNADDWGRDVDTTDRSLECLHSRAISCVSAMVFMKDSERAASLARQHDVEVGLHLNLTTSFSEPQCSAHLLERQLRLSRFLRSNRFAPAMYHPGLTGAFDYVFKAQMDEFERLYGVPPGRVDGHHHMHLCANVLVQRLLPAGAIVRRNFSFRPGEKSGANRLYRRLQDSRLGKRHRMADLFFALPSIIERRNFETICDLATRFNVEIEAHPIVAEEYRFLLSGELMSSGCKIGVVRGYKLHTKQQTADKGVAQ